MFNWIEVTLQEFLEKSLKKKREDTSIISNYVSYKKEIKKHFGVVNEAQAAETKLLSLQQKHSAAEYAVKFQHITSLTDWDNSTLTALYYWGLREFIKNEIVRADWPEILQDMVDLVIQIDSCQWKRQRERKRHWHEDYRQPKYTEHRYYLDSMDLDEFEKCNHTSRVSGCGKGRGGSQNNQPTKIYDKKSWDDSETWKCYNCEKPEHLARDCKRPRKRSEIKAFVTVLHESLSWTVCYDDMCWVHQSNKNSSEWYSQQNKQKKNCEEYNTTDLPVRELNTLKKTVTPDTSTEAEIEETDIWGTQVNNSAWMYVNSDDNSENIDDWEVEMGVKRHHTHSKNLERKRKEHYKKEWDTIVQETKKFNWLEEVETNEWNVQWQVQTPDLCDITQRVKGIVSQAQTTMAEKQHTIQIKIFTEYRTANEELWTWKGKYVPSEFLKQVRSLKSQLQGKYDQYDPQLYSEWCVVKSSKEYVMLLQGKEPQWFKNLWRRETVLKKDQLPSQD